MNTLRTASMQGGPPCPRVEGRARIAAELSGYLSDESRMTAEGVDVIFFPESLQDVCEAVRECAEAGMTLTVAGARTGIVGGAVPAESQAVISLERLNHIKALRYEDKTREFSAQVEAGVILQDFQEALHNTHARDLPWADDESRTLGTAVLQAEGRRLFYPVDPTETSAQIGGTVATNASGARTFRYGPTRVWVKALTVVLKQFPQFNASLDPRTSELILKRYYRIGVAVDTEAGLIVPVLGDVDTKNLLTIAAEMNELAERTRQRKISLDELRGGTFTVTNLGGIGGTAFTPIINYPEVAILGLARAREQPRLAGGQWQSRLVLPLCLSYDHRVINGADGARFIRRLVELLEDPELTLVGA